MAVLKLFASDILNAVTRLSYHIISRSNFYYREHTHDFFEIFLVSGGSIVHHVNGVRQILHEGAMVLIRPEDVHFYEEYENSEYRYINVALNYFIGYESNRKAVPAWLEHLIAQMRKKENFTEGLSAMLRLSHKSKEYISRVLKENTGKTPMDFINELRLNYAANMLVHSDEEILDIALDSGFNNLSHFYHLFKSNMAFRRVSFENPGIRGYCFSCAAEQVVLRARGGNILLCREKVLAALCPSDTALHLYERKLFG